MEKSEFNLLINILTLVTCRFKLPLISEVQQVKILFLHYFMNDQ
jgi:hypothetical protein